MGVFFGNFVAHGLRQFFGEFTEIWGIYIRSHGEGIWEIG